VIELGRETCVNNKHFSKQLSPSEMIEFGISIDSILNLIKHSFPNEQNFG
jgi:hypothetical protein